MSKKAQPQKAQNPKPKLQTVDEQNEPFLRALQKKVRNINKKLTEIAELQTKENLKPEQIQKINRKEALIEERTKVEETAVFFKQVYAENAAHYRNNQLRELEILARAISVYHAAPQIPEQTRLAALWKGLQQHENHANLNAAIGSLSTLLKDFANDRKLQKALTTYVQKHGNEQIKLAEINQEKIINDILEEKPEKVEPKLQQPPAKVEVVPEVIPTPVVNTQSEPVLEKAPEVPQVVIQPEPTPVQEPATTQQPAEQQKQPAKRDYKPRDNRDNRDRPYRGKGNYRGNNNRDRREGEGERRQYKPKFEEKREENESSSESSEEARQFRREEIKKLQDEGFIVVGKPKPKPKDSHEQQRNYEKQHGKKYHHHHQANNQ